MSRTASDGVVGGDVGEVGAPLRGVAHDVDVGDQGAVSAVDVGTVGSDRDAERVEPERLDVGVASGGDDQAGGGELASSVSTITPSPPGRTAVADVERWRSTPSRRRI